MGKARRIISLPEITPGLGSRSHASLGTVADVSRSSILFARSICGRGRMAGIRNQQQGGGGKGCQRSEDHDFRMKEEGSLITLPSIAPTSWHFFAKSA